MTWNFVTKSRLTRGKGRPRKHPDNAAKQAAYRANKAKREPLQSGQLVELPGGAIGAVYWSKTDKTLVMRGCEEGKTRYWTEVETASLIPLPRRTSARFVDPNIPYRALKRPVISFSNCPVPPDRDRALGDFYGMPTRRIRQEHIDHIVAKLVEGAKK